MKNPPNSSEQALEDYFRDLLLSEPMPAKGGDAAPFKATVVEAFSARPPAARLLRSTDIATASAANAALPLRAYSESRPRSHAEPRAQLAEQRAYAEPIKTLNLRIPLPTLAPAAVPVETPPTAIAPVAKTATEQVPPPAPAALSEEHAVAEQPAETEIEIASEAAHQAPPAWLDNGRPAWAQRPFECLIFKVGGLALAAPLAELGSIYPLEPDMLTAIFGQAAWFMGLLPVKGYNVRVIDAAQVVMPERYAAAMRDDYRYVITLHGSDWGLAVDSVANSLILQPDEVRWRGQRSKRPWLAGTVVSQMCALLDVAQLVWMFENQDGKRMAPQS